MMMPKDPAGLVCLHTARRRGGLSGLDLLPLHAPRYNASFSLCEE
jgi:hypothetical protein